MAKTTAMVGVSYHAGWAVLVTVARDGALVDRRRVELLETGLPVLPHHHDARGLPPDEGVALVKLVRASAERCARAVLDALSAELSIAIAGIALRECPELPPTIAERIASYHAQTRADSVMYRDVLAGAARAREWSVSWYEPKRVFDDAARALRRETISDLLSATGKSLGPPWQKDHRLAMAGAIAALRARPAST